MTWQEYQSEYERLFKWRARWTNLSNRPEAGRLQSRQDAIERRAAIANNRIGALIQRYDAQTRLTKGVEIMETATMSKYTRVDPPSRIWIDGADLSNLNARGRADYFPNPYKHSDGPSDGESIEYVPASKHDALIKALRETRHTLEVLLTCDHCATCKYCNGPQLARLEIAAIDAALALTETQEKQNAHNA